MVCDVIFIFFLPKSDYIVYIYIIILFSWTDCKRKSCDFSRL